jgi:hypothetical protein
MGGWTCVSALQGVFLLRQVVDLDHLTILELRIPTNQLKVPTLLCLLCRAETRPVRVCIIELTESWTCDIIHQETAILTQSRAPAQASVPTPRASAEQAARAQAQINPPLPHQILICATQKQAAEKNWT